MISLELKPDTKTESKLPLSSKDAPTSALSFASLLHGIQDQETELKLPQNGALVLSLKENAGDEKHKEAKNPSAMLALLKPEELQTLKEEVKSLELNPQVTQNKTVSELKVIIQEAKQYLKDKITSLEGFKKSEIESLPKTLKGLTQVAKKFGIDVSKITLEEVKQSVTAHVVKDEKTTQKFEKTLKTETIDTEKTTQIAQATKKVSKTVTSEKTAAVQVKEQIKTEQKTQAEQKTQIEQKTQVGQKAQAEQTHIKQTPLFKAHEKIPEITTQQFVSTKMTTNGIEKLQKQKADNTLELLLRGNKKLKSDTGMTADFSVATAKVIAPSTTKETQNSLEALLNGDSVSETPQNKTDSLQLHKADSFEVKVNEAKQMIKYLSHDVKQAIEDYKAPFTRVKVQLNPQRLGEVDLTVVQRGKNLHINLSSNNAAINTLAMNANDLKVQLNNSGIQNASLNFSNSSQGDQSGSGSHAHQQQHNRENAQEEYGYFQQEDASEEIVSSLEIVVPHYA